MAVIMFGNKRWPAVPTGAKAVHILRVNVLIMVDVARRGYYLKLKAFRLSR